MRKPNRMLLTIILITVCTFGYSQSRDCNDIKVETKSIFPDKGSSNGSIELVFETDRTDLKVFLVNAGEQQAQTPITDGKIKNLKSGFYDIIIIDKKGCVKQLTITLRDK